MKFKNSLGIDISKKTFDYALLDSEGLILSQGAIENTSGAILEWINGVSYYLGEDWSDTLVCMEHTGFYSSILLQHLQVEVEAKIWLENAIQIKRSIGLVRGKNDAIDALRIATYALDFQRKANMWVPTSSNIERLTLLVSHRDRLVKNLTSIKCPLNEEKGFISDSVQEELEELSEPVLDAFVVAIKDLNKRIKTLISKDVKLSRQAKIIGSIPGFGPVITAKLILVTQGFTKVNNPRKLACFAGVAPFPHRSGTSIRGKSKVSHFANKKLKKLLHLSALVTIRKNNIMVDYYERKVSEGKNKMAVINAIRNKLIHILMACIKNDTMYQKNYNHSLVIT